MLLQQLRIAPVSTSVYVAADLLEIIWIRIASRTEELRANTDSLDGTMMTPGEVAARTSRRQRTGYIFANCCASAPPHETPKTSTGPSKPSRVSNLSVSFASVAKR